MPFPRFLSQNAQTDDGGPGGGGEAQGGAAEPCQEHHRPLQVPQVLCYDYWIDIIVQFLSVKKGG